MLSKLEKKILQVKSVKIRGVKYEFRRCTPEDFLGKEGIPISKWELEAKNMDLPETQNSKNWKDTKITFKKLFMKSLVSVNGTDKDIEFYVDIILENYFTSVELYTEIVRHCLQIKKKLNLLNIFQKTPA